MPTLTPTPEISLPREIESGYEFLQLFLASPTWYSIVLWLKIAGFFVSALFLLAIIVLIIRLNIIGDTLSVVRGFFRPFKQKTKAVFQKRFERARQRLKQGTEEEDRLVILEADRILEDTLVSLGYEQKTMVEKFHAVKPWHIKNAEDVKRAHELRNRIVHEPGTPVSHFEAEEAFKIYENALRELEVF